MFDLKWYALVEVVIKFRARMDDSTNDRGLIHNLRYSITKEDITQWCYDNDIGNSQLNLVIIYVGILKMYFNIQTKSDIVITQSLLHTACI